MLNSNVLLLSHSYIPITVTSARRAVIMVYTGKAEIVETTGRFLHSVSVRFDIPSIIRLLAVVKVTHVWKMQLSKQNVIKRDRGVCQYCGASDGPMTVDHVIPRALGGGDGWDNLVCACAVCNNKKGGRTPSQAGMQLLNTPRRPTIATFIMAHRIPVNSDWRPYIMIAHPQAV